MISFPEQEINTASQQLVQQHANQFVGQRILQQVNCLNMLVFLVTMLPYLSVILLKWCQCLKWITHIIIRTTLSGCMEKRTECMRKIIH